MTKTTLKTVWTAESVDSFLEDVEDSVKRADAFKLIEIMRKKSGCEPKMWGPSIIGFGSYHYKYESGHEGDAPLIGFSPRKAAFSLYVTCDVEEQQEYLKKFGKHKTGKGCIYFNKLADIDAAVLKKMIKLSIKNTHTRYP
ncbi:MAG: DUF1801 domain-containing protein [Bacteroidota bacterium]|nr:DUF1801 domain-containing protein [Bacteroidota bacterium]